MSDLREAIQSALAACTTGSLAAPAKALFNTLGYESDRTAQWTLKSFLELGAALSRPFTARDQEELGKIQSLHLLFQISDAEVSGTGDLFDSSGTVDAQRIESYLFFAADLPPGHQTRGDLTALARLVNKPLPMPAIVLFRHGEKDDPLVSLAILRRRLHKKDAARDVLEKATLIKDIRCADPIRAHLEILNDFSLPRLREDEEITSFVKLHAAWEKKLDSYSLSNTFYREIADWYFWAHHQVEDGAIRLPQHCDTEQEKSLFLIRLLTRVIFCWFLVEKRLIPAALFRTKHLQSLLADLSPQAPTYYHAILQNLFFGTLNMPPDQRGFRERKKGGQRYDGNYGITNLWRYETAFRDPAAWRDLAARVPFLNGGLFDCLDDKSGKKQDNFILDGFSDNPKLACHLPNDLFFGPERTVDLSRDYGEETSKTARSKKAKVRGLIEILSRYKFTIEENTPLEEEIALDPELLGKVFENLLASYNEDTRTTARKALGAFYTPREIVSYMVDEALKSYLQTQMVGQTFLSASSKRGAEPPVSDSTPSSLAITQRRLPHWKNDGAIYWITFRLADSLPQEKLHAWREQREIWKRRHPEPWSEQDWAEYDERFGHKLDEWLDAGMGSRALARPDVRDAVKTCLLKFDGERLQIHSAVIMPNHVHALIEPMSGHDLSTLLKGIKGASAHEANKLLGASGTFWLDESYDHIVRSEEQYRHFLRYIADNPSKAGLRAGEYWLREGAPQGGADIPVCDLAPQRQTRMSAPLSKRLDALFTTKSEPPQFTSAERDALIAAIGRVKILDPACGSGAFPMGALHRLVDLLQKLDPNNESWKRDRLAEARRYRELIESSGTDIPVCADGKAQTGLSALQSELDACDARIADIEKSFDTRFHALDFARKLYLIENAIYGVDIQPIATQIARLRFFISLVVDQKVESGTDTPVCAGGERQTRMSATPWNLGIRPLPNLETKFVAADTLIPIAKTESDLFSGDLDRLRAELADIRHQHFNARSPAAKRKWREADEAKRRELAALLENSHALSRDTARQLAAWDPYDQNTSAPFFDSEWMFGLKPNGGADIPVCDSPKRQAGMPAPPSQGPFDIVIGNPPYVRQEKIKHLKPLFQPAYPDTYTGTADLYVYFYDCALRLLRSGGTLSYITSNSFLNSAFGEKLRHHLITTTRFIVLVDFAEANVFTAITEPCVLIASKGTASGSSFKALRWDQEKKPENFIPEMNARAFNMPQGALGRTPWQIEVPTIRNLLELLSSRGKPLGEFVKNRFCYGIKTGLNEAFIIDQGKRDEIARDKRSAQYLKPFLRGKDLRRWHPKYCDQWLIVIPSSENAPHPWSGQKLADAEKTFQRETPAIYAHFKPLREKLIARADQGQYYWELRSCAYYEEFSKPKVIYQEINRTDSYAFDDSGLYMNNKLFMLPEAPMWLVGILNSPVARFFLHRSTGVPEGGFLALQWPVFSPLPIAEPGSSQVPSLVSLINALRATTGHFADHPAEQTTRDPQMLAYWERILNGLVYELYFPEEVRGSLKGSLFDLVEAAGLPKVEQTILSAVPAGLTDTNVCATFLPRLRQKFEELHDGAHPLRRALDHLQTLETIRIIEGRT